MKIIDLRKMFEENASNFVVSTVAVDGLAPLPWIRMYNWLTGDGFIFQLPRGL